VRRTGTRLSDGRELLYYDSDDAPPRTAEDERELDATVVASEIRRDPLSGEQVLLAAHRQTRTHLPPAADCPLCPSRDGHHTEIPESDYQVVVFENRFPSLGTDPDLVVEGGTELSPRRPGVGRCEVISFSPDHDGAFDRLSPERLRTIVDVWADRTAELSALPEVEQVFVFENRGVEIGVTLHHPHGQIYGYPFVPPRTARMLQVARDHLAQTGRCIACDVLKEELQSTRVVLQTPGWVAYVPSAARWPFEVALVPRRHVPDLAALDDDERAELGELQADVLRRLDGVFDLPMPYMAGWLQAPVRSDREVGHLRLEIVSSRRSAAKLKYLAASESVMGAFINDIAPEQAAEMLRAAA
jgi:UDPglucose--hexose-1-phosphate uridylyltransferase